MDGGVMERGPLFRQEAMYIAGEPIDIDAMLRPGGICYVREDQMPVVIPAREWFEPIEDET